ncbi:MAG: tape measure protein [Fusobacterium sp.]|nr:tape measure protein [Fusobacterium sp.]
MATIQSSIQLMDQMSGPLMNIVSSINTTISALKDINNTNVNIDTTSLITAQTAISQAGATIKEMENQIRNNTSAQNEFNNSLQNSTLGADKLLGKLKKVAAAYMGVQTVKAGINLSDTMTQNTARLNLMNDGKQSTPELQNMIFQSAQNSRGNYLDTTDSIAKMGLMAPDAFNSNKEIVGFMELINKQFKIAGTSTGGIDAAMLQLTQAMGSGVLRGEELNSILEQAPIIVRNIAKYMNIPVGQIKDIASKGKITATIVKNAMFAAVDDINSQFESIPMTFTDIATKFKNDAVKNFEPVAVQINNILNSSRVKEFVANATSGISTLVNILSPSLNLIIAVGTKIYDNWSIIEPVLGTVIATIAAYNIGLGIMAVKTGIVSGATLIHNLALIAHSILLGTTNEALIATTSAQWGLNAAMLACPVTWIAAGIIAVIGVLYLGVAIFNKFAGTSISATGIVVGAFYGVVTVVKNAFAGVYNYTMQMIETVYNALTSISEFIVNVLFGNPFKAIGNFIMDLVILAINGLKLLGTVSDTILGTNTVKALDGLQNRMEEFKKNNIGENIVEFARLDLSEKRIKYEDPLQAAKNGYNSWENINLGSVIDEETKNIFKNIEGNTKSMSDSLDLSLEEVKYMRDLAEMEVINRFTTAEVKVEVQNNNTISSSMDLDDVVDGITGKLSEKVQMMAEGVYD